MNKWILSLGLSLFFTGTAFAQERLLLIPVDETAESGFIVENVSFDENSREVFENLNREVKDRDLEKMLSSDFTVNNYINDHLTIEGQVSAFVMALSGRGSIGHRFLGDHLEVGVDAGAMLVLAGSGVVSPEVGAYVKARLNPEDSVTYYFKGRLYKAWGLADDITRTIDYGLGAELKNGAFFELTIKHFARENKSDFMIPFFTFGHRFAGPKTAKSNDEYLFSKD